MHHFTCWTLFISRINRPHLCKGLNNLHRQPNSDLAQLAEHYSDDLEVGSNPTGGNFGRNLFCSVLTSDLSDKLKEMRIMKNWIVFEAQASILVKTTTNKN